MLRDTTKVFWLVEGHYSNLCFDLSRDTAVKHRLVGGFCCVLTYWGMLQKHIDLLRDTAGALWLVERCCRSTLTCWEMLQEHFDLLRDAAGALWLVEECCRSSLTCWKMLQEQFDLLKDAAGAVWLVERCCRSTLTCWEMLQEHFDLLRDAAGALWLVEECCRSTVVTVCFNLLGATAVTHLFFDLLRDTVVTCDLTCLLQALRTIHNERPTGQVSKNIWTKNCLWMLCKTIGKHLTVWLSVFVCVFVWLSVCVCLSLCPDVTLCS